MSHDRNLLTPGPLTTSLQTKLAMLRDWGSWDTEFNAVTARVRASLLSIVHGEQSHVVVPLQGSGTFSVEAAVATVVPRSGHVLVLDNGVSLLPITDEKANEPGRLLVDDDGTGNFSGLLTIKTN